MQHTLKPYLINAFYTWSLDLNHTPLIKIHKWSKNKLPEHITHEYINTLKIHPSAVKNLVLGKDKMEFEALFNQTPFKVTIYYDSISCIYNLEDDYGIEFEVKEESSDARNKKRPTLVLVKSDKKDTNDN